MIFVDLTFIQVQTWLQIVNPRKGVSKSSSKLGEIPMKFDKPKAIRFLIRYYEQESVHSRM